MFAKFASACTALLLLTACSPARPPWADGAMVTERVAGTGAPQDLGNLSGRITSLHNRERQAAGVPPLAWDEALAASAAAYGPSLARLGRLQHSSAESRAGQGENLWMGTRGAYSIEEMVGGWIGEKRIFRPGIFPNDVSASGSWSDVGHYTQMIWRDTRRVGCALHQTPRWDYLICRYSPAGNIVGQRVP
jgi:hypothetical protein